MLVPGPVLHDVGRHVYVLDQGQEEASLPVRLSRPSSTCQEAVNQLAQRTLHTKHEGVGGGLLEHGGRSIRQKMKG